MAKLNPTIEQIYESLTFFDSMVLQYHKLSCNLYVSGAEKPIRVIVEDLTDMLGVTVSLEEYKASIKKLKKVGFAKNI